MHSDVLIIVLVVVGFFAVIAILLVISLYFFIIIDVLVIVVIILVTELLLIVLHLIVHVKIETTTQILKVGLLSIFQIFFEQLEILVEFIVHFYELVYALVIDLTHEVILV